MLGKMHPRNMGEHFPQKSSTPAIATSNTHITGGKKRITGKLDHSVLLHKTKLKFLEIVCMTSYLHKGQRFCLYLQQQVDNTGGFPQTQGNPGNASNQLFSGWLMDGRIHLHCKFQGVNQQNYPKFFFFIVTSR